MTMNELTEREALAVVDDALRTYPLAPTPPTLAAAALSRIHALRPGPRPRFRLAWIDYAISLFAAGMAGLTVTLWQFIPLQMIGRARLRILLWQALPGGEVFIASLVGGAILAITALAIAAAVFARRPLQAPR
jgi:hypothetical protein